MLSYGSLESLANLANSSSPERTETNLLKNNNYRNDYNNFGLTKVTHTENSTNYTTQRVTKTDYGTSTKYNNGSIENQNGRGYTHGILKNKNNNYKSPDVTDAVHERFINGTSSFTASQERRNKGSSPASGTALDVLPVHKPTSFILDSSIDASKTTVTITGE